MPKNVSNKKKKSDESWLKSDLTETSILGGTALEN